MPRRIPGRAGRPRILIVEDNALNMELAAGLLETAGFDTIEAWDAEGAIRLAREKRPELILMDIGLPGMDGLSATQIIKENPETEDIPIIALTANDGNEEEKRAFRLGCEGFITKPISIRNFTKEISVFLGHRLSRAKAV